MWIRRCGSATFAPANREFAALLSEGSVLAHPFVIGELACSSLKDRKGFLAYLNELPLAVAATNEEVMHLLYRHSLWSRGIGWVDAHLIASALLSDCRLWSLDASLRSAAAHAKVHVR